MLLAGFQLPAQNSCARHQRGCSDKAIGKHARDCSLAGAAPTQLLPKLAVSKAGEAHYLPHHEILLTGDPCVAGLQRMQQGPGTHLAGTPASRLPPHIPAAPESTAGRCSTHIQTRKLAPLQGSTRACNSERGSAKFKPWCNFGPEMTGSWHSTVPLHTTPARVHAVPNIVFV